MKLLGVADLIERGVKDTPLAIRTAYFRIASGALPREAMPPRLVMPGSRRILVAESDFEAWVAGMRRTGGELAPSREGGKGKGKPKKRESVAADRLGITVPELRAQRSGK